MSSFESDGVSRRTRTTEHEPSTEKVHFDSHPEAEDAKKPKSSRLYILFQVVVCIVSGVIFGLALEKGRGILFYLKKRKRYFYFFF